MKDGVRHMRRKTQSLPSIRGKQKPQSRRSPSNSRVLGLSTSGACFSISHALETWIIHASFSKAHASDSHNFLFGHCAAGSMQHLPSSRNHSDTSNNRNFLRAPKSYSSTVSLPKRWPCRFRFPRIRMTSDVEPSGFFKAWICLMIQHTLT